MAIRVIECAGPGRARGRAHGEAAAEAIERALQRWPGERLDAFLEATDFLPAIERHTPDLLEELRGIAEGAGAGLERIVALNAMDEEWWFEQDRKAGSRAACSTFAVAAREGRPALIGQTMDLPDVMDGSQVLLHVKPDDGPEAVVLSSAGMIGLCGANGAGLGVCVNALSMLRHAADGLPVACVTRGLLAQPSLGHARQFVLDVPHSSGQDYVLASADGVEGYECSAGGVTRFEAEGAALCHTNHPLRTDDVDPDAPTSEAHRASSRRRLEALEAGVDDMHDLADCQRLLADRDAPISYDSSEKDPWFTFGAVAFALGSPVQARISAGPPHRSAWDSFDLM
jgi:isopenicillin-N N-acyltransferase like protein